MTVPRRYDRDSVYVTCKNTTDHYLLTDVLLLTNVFQHYRQSVMNRHNLDCLHFITLPSLSWAMALKYTGAKLELITDPEAYLMIKGNMRGWGYCYNFTEIRFCKQSTRWQLRRRRSEMKHHLSRF